MSLVDLLNEMEEQDEEMSKIAAEEDAAGRIMARGFVDELNKIAEKLGPYKDTPEHGEQLGRFHKDQEKTLAEMERLRKKPHQGLMSKFKPKHKAVFDSNKEEYKPRSEFVYDTPKPKGIFATERPVKLKSGKAIQPKKFPGPPAKSDHVKGGIGRDFMRQFRGFGKSEWK